MTIKFAAKCIANRLKKVITSIISEEQTGFIKGRYIGENVWLISEVIENANKTDEPRLIFFTDFNKAFDSLDHSFLSAILLWDGCNSCTIMLTQASQITGTCPSSLT